MYTFKVDEQPPEFTQVLKAQPLVEVTITDGKEERPAPKDQPLKVEITGEDTSLVAGQSRGDFPVDKKPRIGWGYGPGMRFGVTALETMKKLTYSLTGDTNQTMVRIDGKHFEIGSGKLIERDVKLAVDPARNTFGGSRTVWSGGKLFFTQILELVPNQQPVQVGGQMKRVLDTVQIRYILENKDNKPHSLGLRLQLDTLIGINDGVPFTVPGLPGLVTQFADFPKDGPVPDFIQALERPNLQNPGTIAHLSLKMGNGMEAPDRVSLTNWPGGGFPEWEVPLLPLAGDSAVILYWKEQQLKPGEKREIGFAYGLGHVASTEPGGKLGLTLGGSFAPGQTFTATAYAQNPTKGQTLTLELPQGLARVEGEGDEKQTVPAPVPGSNNTSVVTWKVKVLQTGSFPLKVVSSNGQSQARTISIARAEGEPESRLTVRLAGAYEPGKEFTVEAKLVSGTKPPALTLKLPSGLVQTAASVVESTPSAEKKETVTLTRWTVKVVQMGKFAVRVEADNGLAVTKTLLIAQPAVPVGGDVVIALVPPFAPGKAFTVKATVTEPLPGQTLSIKLPTGLRFVEGEEKMAVPRTTEPTSVISWKVMVDRPGVFPLRVESSNGIALKKTITIEQRQEVAGGNFDLAYAGDIEPGKEFKLITKVSQPVPGQKLTLQLPRQMELIEGPAVHPVPTGKDGTSLVTWRVRVLDKGTMELRVESSTGMSRKMTITLTTTTPSASGGQIFPGK
jgi:hypothetical protein